MKRKWLTFWVVLIGGGFALFWTPWWSTLLISFLSVLLIQKGTYRFAFLFYGLAGAILWFTITMFTDLRNQQILSSRMAELFHLPNAYFLWLVEAIVGFISAGLGAWLAGSLKHSRKSAYLAMTSNPS